MDNYYVYFATNLNLIFVAAKLFGFVDWSWLWVMAPMIIMTTIGIAVAIITLSKQRKLQGDIKGNLQHLRDLVESARVKRGH